MSTLSHSHLLFATEYLSNGGNATTAYQVAYTQLNKQAAGVSAARLMARADIKEHIAEAQQQVIARGIWSQEEIILDLKEIATDQLNNKNVRLMAYSLGMKALGMDKQEVKHSGTVNNTVENVTSLSEDEVRARYNSIKSKMESE